MSTVEPANGAASRAARQFTPRGFRVFLDRSRPEEERLYGKDVAVQVVESSIAFRGAHVRIYEGDDGVQLNVTETRLVVAALTEFLAEAEADELTEPADATGDEA